MLDGRQRARDNAAMLSLRHTNDPRAFSSLVDRWRAPILRLCTRMTGDRHLAEDLTQETFARVLAHAGEFRRGSRFSTYLWRIALNLCRDEHRRDERRGARAECDGTGLVADDAPPDALAAGHEQAEMVRTALGRLPDHYRSVVVLRHYEGLKFREIAQVLAIPEGTVKSRMAEALNRLGDMLGPALDDG